MNKNHIPLRGILRVLCFVAICQIPHVVDAQSSGSPVSTGIQPLILLENGPLHQLIPPHVRPLLLPQEQERFLQELEAHPPEWSNLQDPDHTKQSENLFQLNRHRDEVRLKHQDILQQPIAFVWSGILRKFLPEYQGFSVAIGPEFTSTSWGTVRFKPMDLPDYLVAIPSGEITGQLLVQQQNDKQIEIGVIFIGRLVPEESLIYDFSHDEKKEGMILPVVQIQDIKYFLIIP